MKYIKLLAPIYLITVTGDPVYEEKENGEKIRIIVMHSTFILGRLNGKRFGNNMASILQAVKIQTAVHEAKKNVIELWDDDYKILAEEVKNGDYDARFAPCLLPFMNAVINASDKPPTTLKEVTNA